MQYTYKDIGYWNCGDSGICFVSFILTYKH